MTRKRLLRVLMGTGMQRNKAQLLVDFVQRHGDTHADGLRYLTRTMLAGRWMDQAEWRCNGQIIRQDGRLCIVRMERGQIRLLSVLPPEIEQHIPMTPRCIRWGRGNGKTQVYQTVNLNLVFLQVLAQIKNGGTT